MAPTVKVEGRPMHMPYSGAIAFLPPRSPHSSGGSAGGAAADPYPYASRATRNPSQRPHHHHQRTPSASVLIEEQPSWLDDLLDDSKAPMSKPASHRRSASDSFAFLDPLPPHDDDNNNAYRAEEGAYAHFPSPFPRFDSAPSSNREGVSSLLAEIEHFQRRQNLPVSASVERMKHRWHDDISVLGLASEPSDLGNNNKEEPNPITADSEFNSNQAKRSIATRHPAQRSRVRKLQYISELEATVNALQNEVSSKLAPQVTYFEHQRMLLNVDNSRMKQRIALLLQENQMKDAQTDALKREAQRCKKLYEIQFQQHLQRTQKPGTASSKWSEARLLRDFSDLAIDPPTKVSGKPLTPKVTSIPPGFSKGEARNLDVAAKKPESIVSLPDLMAQNT